MNTIGQRIKEYRRKCDLTQEKLADFLCVSYQAVSKWECGVANPDITMIGPQTKVLGISSDELLGLIDAGDAKRREELEKEYRESWNTGDLDKREEIVNILVSEYPHELKYRDWLADCIYYRAFDYEGERFAAEIERSIKCYEMVIEGSPDGYIRNSAISGIVIAYSMLGRYDEGKKYAELYPEFVGSTKDEVMWWCLTGDERVKQRHKVLSSKFEDIIGEMHSLGTKYGELIIAMIKQMIPDENYLYHHTDLFRAYIAVAKERAVTGDLDGAVEALVKARHHAGEFDRMCNEGGVYRYTSPYLEFAEVNTTKIMRTGTSTDTEDFVYFVTNADEFIPLRDRPDFMSLLK